MKFFFKAILGGFIIFSTLFLFGAGVGFWWVHQQFNKPGQHDQALVVHVERGMSIGHVSDILLNQGVFESPNFDPKIFSYGGRVTGQASKIKAGEYEIPARYSMRQILDLLESGKTIQRNVTVREGLTSYEIVNLLAEEDRLEQVDLDIPAEGTLLAETYSFSTGDSTADIINRMQEAMIPVLDDLWEGRHPDLPLKTKEEAVILASIIEKETAVPSERKRVAGVFVNRLRRGMLLQTDPTVIYAITKGEHKNDGKGPLGRRLLKKDLEFDSPYNTYLYAGLPPGPIANVGRASLEAALNPETHDYLYFVADGTGGHAFAKSLNEHNRNVANWRKVRKTK